MLEPKMQIKKEQASAYLGVSLSTLDRLVKAGKLSPLRVSSKIVYFSLDDLDAYLKKANSLRT